MNTFIYNQSMSDYQAADGINASGLKRLMESPLDYNREQRGLITRKQTKAMQLGTLLHSYILEDQQTFIVRPSTYPTPTDSKPWNGNANWCKEWLAAQSLSVITEQEAESLKYGRQYLNAHPKAALLLDKARFEVSMFADIGGRKMKGRADILGNQYIADLKTVEDASAKEFSKAILTYGWHIQAALYTRIAEAITGKQHAFYFIAFEKSELPKVNVLKLDEDSLEQGGVELDAALDLLEKCHANNHWPEWSDYDGTNEIKSVSIPAYGMTQEQEVIIGGETVII